jgi:hypothetical protein
MIFSIFNFQLSMPFQALSGPGAVLLLLARKKAARSYFNSIYPQK